MSPTFPDATVMLRIRLDGQGGATYADEEREWEPVRPRVCPKCRAIKCRGGHE